MGNVVQCIGVNFQLTAGTFIDTEFCTLLGDIARICGSTPNDGNIKLHRQISYADRKPWFCFLPTVCWDCSDKRMQLDNYIQILILAMLRA